MALGLLLQCVLLFSLSSHWVMEPTGTPKNEKEKTHGQGNGDFGGFVSYGFRLFWVDGIALAFGFVDAARRILRRIGHGTRLV